MAASSSVHSSLLRRRAPYIPLVTCSDCGVVVKRGLSGTTEHDGWVFYKCKTHGQGCNFWYWELEYVQLLCENQVLTGDAAIDVHGWAEERREALEIRKKQRQVRRPGNEDLLMKKLSRMVDLLTEAILVLKIVVGLLAVVCLMLVQKK